MEVLQTSALPLGYWNLSPITELNCSLQFTKLLHHHNAYRAGCRMRIELISSVSQTDALTTRLTTHDSRWIWTTVHRNMSPVLYQTELYCHIVGVSFERIWTSIAALQNASAMAECYRYTTNDILTLLTPRFYSSDLLVGPNRWNTRCFQLITLSRLERVWFL